jgi:hypothetical protein
MYRTLLMLHLAQVDRFFSQGERHIVQQKELILRMERGGDEITEATQLLRQMQKLQVSYIATRERLLKELTDEPS